MRDAGLELVNYVFERMQIDSKWSVRHRRGFTWWGKDHAQHVWADPPVEDDGIYVSRVHARTEVGMGFRSDAANLGKLSALNCFASLNALLPEEDETAQLNFVSNVYVHEETPHSIRELFKVAVAMQAANGQIWGERIEQLFDAQSARSAHPVSGPRGDSDDMLEVMRDAVAPEGRKTVRWKAADLQEAGGTLQQILPVAQVVVDPSTGLSAVIPFSRQSADSALIMVQTTEAHPQLGNGVFIRLTPPLRFVREEPELLAARLNRLESRSWTATHFLGAWCSMKSFVHFVTFCPNLAYRPGLLTNLLIGMMTRLFWLRSILSAREAQ